MIDALEDVLKDGFISDDEHEDIFCLIENIIDYKALDDTQCTAHLNTLLGILKGSVADKNLNNAEILFMKHWLAKNADISQIWPVPELTHRINQILADGVITTQERNELYQLIIQVTGMHFHETGDAANSPMTCFDSIATITHAGHGFCFTGKFSSNTRRNIEAIAQNLGGIIIKSVPTHGTHYVVVGLLSSRDWAYSSHGRKIAKAKLMQSQGHNIVIVSEDQWLSALA